MEAVARRVYGAKNVFWYPQAEQKLTQFTREGLAALPVCIAKTHLSLSADASLLNAPEEFTLPVRDIRAYTGAGWLVPLCGEITQMPGLGKTPGAAGVDIDADGAHRRPVLNRRALSSGPGLARRRGPTWRGVDRQRSQWPRRLNRARASLIASTAASRSLQPLTSECRAGSRSL